MTRPKGLRKTRMKRAMQKRNNEEDEATMLETTDRTPI